MKVFILILGLIFSTVCLSGETINEYFYYSPDSDEGVLIIQEEPESVDDITLRYLECNISDSKFETVDFDSCKPLAEKNWLTYTETEGIKNQYISGKHILAFVILYKINSKITSMLRNKLGNVARFAFSFPLFTAATHTAFILGTAAFITKALQDSFYRNYAKIPDEKPRKTKTYNRHHDMRFIDVNVIWVVDSMNEFKRIIRNILRNEKSIYRGDEPDFFNEMIAP